jgi:cyclopropane-fatty-acyl-phospholipid synthase
MYNLAYNIMAKNLIPDPFIRWGIRKLCKKRLVDEKAHKLETSRENFYDFIDELKSSSIAKETDAANEQHYEVPSEFYTLCLGENLKYSSSLFKNKNESLHEAENNMLELYIKRSGVVDGDEILDLGCGWGSLSLHLAKKFPNSKITGLSNSSTQKTHINHQAQLRGISNLEIVTGDINKVELNKTFDKILSIEMFEHMRNYKDLFKKVANWLKADGKVFLHVFCHKEIAYPFEVKDESDWMSKYFFTGGIMPSEDLFFHFQEDLKISKHWRVNGKNYQLTSEKWLENITQNKKRTLELLANTYGKDKALEKWVQWRVFFMACAELFGYNKGNEWFVSHYLFEKQS